MIAAHHSVGSMGKPWYVAMPNISLPSGYSRLEYVKFGTNHYLDTGIVFYDETYSVKAGMSSNGGYDVHYMGWWGHDAGGLRLTSYRVSTWGGTNFRIPENATNNRILNFTGCFVSWWYDGVEYKSSPTDERANDCWGSVNPQASVSARGDLFAGIASTNPDTFVLNCQRLWSVGNQYQGYIGARFWYFITYHGKEMICCMIPAIDPNAVVCMYDVIRKAAFYPNSGSLSAGPAAVDGSDPVPVFTEPVVIGS